mgnify:CR=1 FL=1
MRFAFFYPRFHELITCPSYADHSVLLPCPALGIHIQIMASVEDREEFGEEFLAIYFHKDGKRNKSKDFGCTTS